MNLSILTMSILLAFGIWTVAGEPRLKFTDHPNAIDTTSPAAGLTSGTAPGHQAVQN